MIKKFLIVILKFYKKYLSPGIKSGCIFRPTCSVYAIEALEKHNLFSALLLIVWRILRCNSFNKGGFDPVPDPKNKKKWLL
ncbi:MAG: membrane protein insertion efficiency factor YidD [Candidatus Borkfalkiaceae bacterium]|nr:membrane protein insertion efficiency factor YidD [Christensenellaceae bacterium]